MTRKLEDWTVAELHKAITGLERSMGRECMHTEWMPAIEAIRTLIALMPLEPHVCDAMPDYWDVVPCEGKWLVAFRDGPHSSVYVNFCPFCGEDLRAAE